MTQDQMVQYKKNYIDNKILEFVCKTGKEPSTSTLNKWSKEADRNLTEMTKQVIKRVMS